MKKSFLYPILILFISLCACNEDKGEPGSQTSSDVASRSIAEEASPDGIKTEISSKNDIFEGGALEKIYSERGYESLWRNGDALFSFYNSLRGAEKEGLNFNDYHGEEIDLLLSEDLNSDQAARLDLLLSDAFLTYARHLYYGKLDPTKLNEFWGISRKEKDLSKLLKKGVETGNFESIFEELRPNHYVYHDLKKSLAEYEEMKEDEGPLEEIPSGELINPGDKDARIPAIAKRLIALKRFEADTSAIDSTYSENLVEAVKKFQLSKSIQTDGIIGNSTIEELNKGPQDRYKQILANLERWRWYPRDLGEHYILINIPHFKLAVVKNGDTIREHNVIAGAKERQTPIFSDTLDHLVINPTWTVPPTIKSQDIIPKMAANRSYLSRNNMTVTGPNGERIDPSSVNWNSDEALNYTFTQKAGPSNPLGRVKIMYPNQYLIYLHDTPAKALFEQTDRAESSGCVRVENAVDLSAYVVEDQSEWTKERIEEIIKTNKTTVVKIDQPIQVHHFYWTAWRAGGETVFTSDVYELDEKIYSQLTSN